MEIIEPFGEVLATAGSGEPFPRLLDIWNKRPLEVLLSDECLFKGELCKGSKS